MDKYGCIEDGRRLTCFLCTGGHCKQKRLSFRLVVGIWALAAFVFVQAYTATLFLYVMAPITSPLINSAYDVAENKDINMLVKKGGTFEHYFKVNYARHH